MLKVVLDTNIFVSALIGSTGASREILRLSLQRRIEPVFGEKLFWEYEDVLARKALFAKSPLKESERNELFHSLLAVSNWTTIYYLWRPNLLDESDNHIIELAVASGAEIIVTNNVKDFTGTQLKFPEIKVFTAAQFLKEKLWQP